MIGLEEGGGVVSFFNHGDNIIVMKYIFRNLKPADMLRLIVTWEEIARACEFVVKSNFFVLTGGILV